jgi:hypothetical protein
MQPIEKYTAHRKNLVSSSVVSRTYWKIFGATKFKAKAKSKYRRRWRQPRPNKPGWFHYT